MNATHFLYLIIPPRQTFVFDASPEERQIMAVHADYHRAACARGLVLMAGPTLDGAYGASVLATADEAEARTFADADPVISSGLMTYRLHPWRVGISIPALTPGSA